jgi:hypothetical protein
MQLMGSGNLSSHWPITQTRPSRQSTDQNKQRSAFKSPRRQVVAIFCLIAICITIASLSKRICIYALLYECFSNGSSRCKFRQEKSPWTNARALRCWARQQQLFMSTVITDAGIPLR